jgi:hypothetical protein
MGARSDLHELPLGPANAHLQKARRGQTHQALRPGRHAVPAASARDDITGACRTDMNKTMGSVRPGDLYRQIRDLTSRLENMALSKAPAASKPRVNTAFNPSLHAKVSREATNQPSRRI